MAPNVLTMFLLSLSDTCHRLRKEGAQNQIMTYVFGDTIEPPSEVSVEKAEGGRKSLSRLCGFFRFDPVEGGRDCVPGKPFLVGLSTNSNLWLALGGFLGSD